MIESNSSRYKRVDMNGINVETLRAFVEQYVKDEPSRLGTEGWWREPLVVTAPVDDRFSRLREMASPEHLHPRDLLSSAESLVVFFIPFRKDLVKENRAGDRPSRSWGLSYVQTNDLLNRLGRALADELEKQGFKSALTPATHNFDEVKLMARWSHKHLGYLANLGRFGVHHLLITPEGCAGRLGSLVTEAALGENPLIHTAEACLFKAGKECLKCVDACPPGALSESGFERRTCWERLKDNRSTLPYFSDLPESTHVCGKCAALMPCSFRNPVAAL